MINDELLNEIIEQLNKNHIISEKIMWLMVFGIFAYCVERYVEYRINKQNTKNEKKGDEELYISEKQYDMEISVFLVIIEKRYDLQNILMEVIQNEGELNMSEKDNCELAFGRLKEKHKELVDYVNKYICFMPLDIWDKIEKYISSVNVLIDEWESIFRSALKRVIVTDIINRQMEKIEKNSDEVTNTIRKYLYKKRIILG